MRFKQVQKRDITIAALGALAIIVLSALSINLMILPQVHQKYGIYINRNVEGQTEERALAEAESINYTDATKLERFNGSDDPEAYLNPGTYLEYTYANYVDSQTLSYYQARYGSLQGKGSPGVIEYAYSANVSQLQSFRIYNSPTPEGVAWHNTTVVMVKSSANCSDVSTSGLMQLYLRNQTGYGLMEWDYDYSFSDCYLVQMDLAYSEVYAPMAAFFSEVRQIVVLDRDYSPVLIGIGVVQALS